MLNLPTGIVVWVCPNCGNFYASANAGDLSKQWNTHHGQPTFRRSRCPNKACAEQGIHREPKLYVPAKDVVIK
jgi:hypothetical protein